MKREGSDGAQAQSTFADLANNPIYTRLTRADRPFSVRAVVVLVVMGIVGSIANALIIWGVLADIDLPGLIDIVAFLAAFAGWFCLVVCPPMLTLTAALMAVDTRGEAFQLVRLTGLSEGQITTGYLLATLHRRWLMLALMLALIPSGELGMVAASLGAQHCYGCPEKSISVANVLGLLVMNATVVGSLLTLTVICTGIGVRLGMRKVSIPVWIGALGVIVVSSLSGLSAVLRLPRPFLSGLGIPTLVDGNPDTGLAAVMCCVLPVLLPGAAWWWSVWGERA